MKSANLLLALVSPILCLTSVGATHQKLSFTFKITSLHSERVDTHFSISAFAAAEKKKRVIVSIINNLYPNGITILDETFADSSTNYYTYNNQYTRLSNNSVKLTIIDIKTNTSQTYTQALDVTNGDTYRINDQVYNYESASTVYTFVTGKWSTVKENITFHNFQDKYVPNYYHKLNLSDFYFERTATIPTNVPFKRGQLIISNIKDSFSALSKNGSTVILDVGLEKNENIYYLKALNDLFVNQKNLDMSFVKKDGYVKTKNIYFPLNNKKNEETYSCTLVLEGLGIDSSDFIVTFKYKSLLNIFGDCHNSEYCIVAN